MYVCFFFFFQAEDGIRDLTVTGVQTCALPICIGDEQLLGSDFRVVEFHHDLELTPGAGDGADDAAAELPVPHALAGDVAGRVLRRLRFPLDLNGRARAAPRAPRVSRPVPLWRRAALLDYRRRQRLKEAGRLRQLQPAVPIAGTRP